MTEENVKLISERISEYRNTETDINNKIIALNYAIRFSSVHNDIINEIETLKTTIEEFVKLGNSILKENIDYDSNEVGITKEEIINGNNSAKNNLKNLKIALVARYNSDIDIITAKVAQIISDSKRKPAFSDAIRSMFVPGKCSKKIRDYRVKIDLSEVDYDELNKVKKKVNELFKQIENVTNEEVEDTLKEIELIQNDILYIAHDIVSLKQVNDRIGIEDVKDNIDSHICKADELFIKLSNIRANLSDDDYSDYFAMLAEVTLKLRKAKEKLALVKLDEYTDEEKKQYAIFKNKIDDLAYDIEYYKMNVILPFMGKFNKDAFIVIDTKISDFEKQIEDMYDVLHMEHSKGFDRQLISNLMMSLSKVNEKLIILKDLALATRNFKNTDEYVILDNLLTKIEKATDILEDAINREEKTIKDKEKRRKIDLAFAKIREELAKLEKNFSEMKVTNFEENDLITDRIKTVKDRLEMISGNYKSKTPFLVKSVKDTKNFYKKHKKESLIAMGLAAISLVHSTVGPIIIPAIMHGNSVIGSSVPELSDFTLVTNKLLGKFIHATYRNDLWHLANGIEVNLNTASTSLMKGVAISTIGSALLATPLVKAVKDLTTKMRLIKLKKSIINDNENEKSRGKR